MNMNIEEELLTCLDKIIVSNANKSRDIEIVAHFFGFGEAQWPTLESTASHFEVGTRERVRQIIKSKFFDRVTLADLPVLRKCSNLLSAKDMWLRNEYRNALNENSLAPDLYSIKGVLNLMHGLSLSEEYGIYDPNVSTISRSKLGHFEDYLIITSKKAKSLKKALNIARSIPGQIGLANTKDIPVKSVDLPIDDLIKTIRLSAYSWMKSDGSDYWYCFEDRDNILVNSAEKIFALTDVVEISRLAVCIRNGLNARSSRYEYPNVALIEDYIRQSIFFECHDKSVRFLGQTGDLTEIQKAVISYFDDHSMSDFKELSTYLKGEGFGSPLISKTITASPIVHVDRSGGRMNFKYSLISSADASENARKAVEPRYTEYLDRLRKLEKIGTDKTIETTTRREQNILREWLFENKTRENCAICGQEFGVNALVAAHKKKRTDCNEKERLDPYIVMPMCLFGCDFLYESGLIYVTDGIIQENTSMVGGTEETKFVNNIKGRKISDEWLKGDANYFDKLTIYLTVKN
jgi:hypothetical protein